MPLPPDQPPPERPRERVAIAVGVLGSVMVVVAAVVVPVLILHSGGGAGDGRSSGLPTDPSRTGITGPPTMPRTIEARGPIAHADLPRTVYESNATTARTFDAVHTEVFGDGRTRETVLVTLATKRDRAPLEYVRAFVPAVAVTEEPAAPGPPGLLRCWSNPDTAMCLWGDEHDLVYVGDGGGVAHARLVIANVYAGSAR
ncbi:hypothetical protein [Streptomyces sp. SID3343]|uniref:hypothetical protein n=1 Tax=Streptomyces sp. SID3343 TaxID=2690260 RepID=UPI001369FF4F|nr:hypothetical protein [Streptomyces sp. SID3343]MYW02288.1 hypothetical protein [Streptomyces sp. SID3343]